MELQFTPPAASGRAGGIGNAQNLQSLAMFGELEIQHLS